MESADSEAAFVGRMLAAVYETRPPGARWAMLGDVVSAILDRVGKVGAGPVQVELATALDRDWQEAGATLFRILAQLDQPTRWRFASSLLRDWWLIWEVRS